MPRRAWTTIAAGRVVASFLVALGVCPFAESVTASDERDPPLPELLEPLPHGWGRHALPAEKVDQLAFLARQIGDLSLDMFQLGSGFDLANAEPGSVGLDLALQEFRVPRVGLRRWRGR